MSDSGITGTEFFLRQLWEGVIGRNVVDNWTHLEPADHLAVLEAQLGTTENLYLTIDGRSCLAFATLVSLTSLRDHLKPTERIRAFALDPAEQQLAQWLLNSSGFYLLGPQFSGRPNVYTALAENTTRLKALAAMGPVVDDSPEGLNGFIVARLEVRSGAFVVLDWRPVSVEGGSYVTIDLDRETIAPTRITISALE